MTRFTADNTEGYSAADLAVLNARYDADVYLPPDALARMSEIGIKSWQDHVAELTLADFDSSQAA